MKMKTTFTREEVRLILAGYAQEHEAALARASTELSYLACAKCGSQFEAEQGKDYSAGVLCPVCKKAGYTMVGVCHLETAKVSITQHHWDALVTLVRELGEADTMEKLEAAQKTYHEMKSTGFVNVSEPSTSGKTAADWGFQEDERGS